jgi:hypothetical protein
MLNLKSDQGIKLRLLRQFHILLRFLVIGSIDLERFFEWFYSSRLLSSFRTSEHFIGTSIYLPFSRRSHQYQSKRIMGKRARADSIGEASSSPKPKGAARGGPGSAPSSSNFSVVPVEVIARMLEYLMETPALLPKRLVSKKWDQAMLCLLEKHPLPATDRIRGVENCRGDPNDQADF